MPETTPPAADVISPVAKPRQSAARTAFAGLIGNVLEWYEMAVYNGLAIVIGSRFFTAADPDTQELLAYLVLAIGFLGRPIGSVALGLVGDRIGRRALLTISIVLMGGATLVIGVVPTYGTIGVAAPLVLLLMRLLQGISLGGEFTGSMVYTTELAAAPVRGIISSSTAAGTTLGFILGSATVSILEATLTSAEIAAWGWRIPFIASVFICIAGFVLRRGLHESEQGERAAKARPPILASLVQDWLPILRTFGIVAMTNAAYYLTYTFAVDYRKKHAGAGDDTSYQLINTLTLFVVLFAKPFGGWLSDRVGRRRLMIAMTVVMLGSIYFAVDMMMHGSPAQFTAGQVLMSVSIGMALGLQGAMLVEIFPLRTRVMSMSIAYSVSVALAGGLMPFIASLLIQHFGDPIVPAYYVMIYGVLGLAIMLPMKETNATSLD